MMSRFTRVLICICVCTAVLWSPLGPGTAMAAQPTADQRAQVRAAEADMRKAGNFFRAKRYAESGQAAQQAIEKLRELPLGDSPELAELAAPVTKQLEKARELLGTQGVAIPDLKMTGDKPGEEDGVSFSRQVAPLLVAKCGGCHVQRARGEFSMATFATLFKGPPSGVVFMAGDAGGSRLVEVIESGDMPRGGGKLTDEELTLLKDWINAGAKFDGNDTATPLATLAAAASPDMPMPTPTVMAAGQDDAVQFARDVGPVLLAHCVECHGERNPPANFGVNTFQRLLNGGNGGPVIVQGKSEDSLLIQKLRGTASGERMPRGRDPLPEETIALVAKWIDLGARFDGTDANLALEETVGRSAAGRMTHDELAKHRVERAEMIWRLILPDVDASQQESKNVLVMGGVGGEILSAVARTAEEQVEKLQHLLRIPDNQALIKGRLMLFVFDKRYDYGEVGTMLEHRELPSQWRGHWSYNPLDAYGCLLLSERGEASPGLVAQQLAGTTWPAWATCHAGLPRAAPGHRRSCRRPRSAGPPVGRASRKAVEYHNQARGLSHRHAAGRRQRRARLQLRVEVSDGPRDALHGLDPRPAGWHELRRRLCQVL